jgi:serine protease Do
MPSVRTAACLAALSLTVLAASPARAAGPATTLAPLPGASRGDDTNPLLTNRTAAPAAPAAAPAPDAAPAGSPAPSMLERVRRGVVLVERDGRLLGFGTVLAGDGRILTSLSSLAGGDAVEIQYADGAVVHAKVGHRDAAWDLALLVPRTIHWKDGLSASQTDPASSDLRAPIPPRMGARPIALPVHFKGRTDAISRQGESLIDALDVEVHNALPVAGAPILDQQANVVGVLVRACKLAVGSREDAAKTGPIGCAPTLIGAPVSALLSFLSKTPPDAVAPTPWLGIAGEPDASGAVHGVRVMAVAPQSPAQKAGLKAASGDGGADRIVAVDGQPVETPEKLSEAIGKHAIGETVKLLVLAGHDASYRDVAVVLRSAP